jgi:hypothetical protein
MRRWAIVAVLALLGPLATACHFSHVNANETVEISGRALTAAGQPLSHIDVHLYKEPDAGEVIIGSVLAIGSLGSICLLPSAPAICSQGHTATTDAHGRYRFTITGADTQGLIGDTSTLDLVFADPNGGTRAATTTLRFQVQQTKVRLPTARLWNAGLHVTAHADAQPTFALSYRRLPGAYGTNVSYGAQFFDPADAATVWTQSLPPGRGRVDARITEDLSTDAAVGARATLHGVDTSYLSARVPASPIAGAPPSRNRPCAAVTGTRRLRTFPQPSCGATDGDFASAARPTAPRAKTVTGVVIDLGRPRPVSLIVARGLSGPVVVEVSANGTSYQRVATSSDATVVVHLAGAPVARYVRVRSPGGLSESLLTEVSAW